MGTVCLKNLQIDWNWTLDGGPLKICWLYQSTDFELIEIEITTKYVAISSAPFVIFYKNNNFPLS